jgi:type I restriction enzyme R subunit
LSSFDDFAGYEILTERQLQDYRSVYLDLYAEFRRESEVEKESINDDVVFEIELIKQVEINVDYILMLVQKWREARGDGSDKELDAVMKIQRAIDSSLTLRSKKDLIMAFVDSVSANGQIDDEWRAFVDASRSQELDRIILDEGLNSEETKAFIAYAFRDGAIPTAGTAISKILSPVTRFSADGGHSEAKQRVLTKLGAFFERFFGLGANEETP